MTDPIYAFCICHEKIRASSYDDYDAGKLTIDIRGWDDRKQAPTYVGDYYGFALHKLIIQAWYSEKFSGTYGTTYGLDLGSDLLTLEAMERYAKPFKALQKKLDAIEAKYGHPKTIGQLLSYVADALKITQFARPNLHYPDRWQGTSNIQDAIAWCDYPISDSFTRNTKRNTYRR